MNTVQKALDTGAKLVQEKNAAPDEARILLPTVVVAEGRQAVSFAYHLGESRPPGPKQPRKVYFPFLEVYVSLPGLNAHLRKISSDDFGLVIPRKDFVGDLGELMRFDMKSYRKLRDRYYELLSAVADHGWLVHRMGSDAERQAAKELSELLGELSEFAFEPYYEVAHRNVRSWVADLGHPFFRPKPR